jgi:hypothetical protein
MATHAIRRSLVEEGTTAPQIESLDPGIATREGQPAV